jgi:uncharacterized protein YjiS (DUF1127 family)
MVALSLSSIGAQRRVVEAVSVARRIAKAWHNRRSARRLLEMNARELADIGLTPADVQLAYGLPLGEDPTERLSAWAAERRSARSGAPNGRTCVRRTA